MNLPRKHLLLLILSLALLGTSARAQTARDLTDIGLDLYRQANSATALQHMREELINAPEAYLVAINQPGTLVLLTRRRVRVPALRYNVALHLLEAQDSTGSHVWPPGSLDGFYLGRGSEARHFRSFAVRNGGPKTDFVEVLTADDNAPLVLALQHTYLHEDAQTDPVLHTETRKARTAIQQEVLAGPGNSPKEALRAVALSPRSVARLFGPRATEIDAFAQKEHLAYTDLDQVLRMVEHYNQTSGK